jgi:hypothetical protein
MDLIAKVQEMKGFWGILLPAVTPPDDRTFAIWVTQFDAAMVKHGFVRAAKKFRVGAVDSEVVHRYVSGVMTNETQRLPQEADVCQ